MVCCSIAIMLPSFLSFETKQSKMSWGTLCCGVLLLFFLPRLEEPLLAVFIIPILVLLIPMEERLEFSGFSVLIAILGLTGYSLSRKFGFTELQVAVTLLTCSSLLYIFFFYRESFWLAGLRTGIPAPLLPASVLAAIEFYKILHRSEAGLSLHSQISGVVLALPLMILFHNWKVLPPGMIFPFEILFRDQILNRDISQAINAGMKWLQLNPGSQTAALHLLAKVAESNVESKKASKISDSKSDAAPNLQHQIRGVRQWFLSLGQWRFRKDHLVLGSTPLEWFLEPIEKSKIAGTLKVSNTFVEAQHFRAAWVLLFQILQSEPTGDRANLFKAWMSLTEKLMKDEKFLQELQTTATASKNFSEVLESYGIWLGQNRSEY